jgi:ribulose-phosphate 3-epimerase
VLAADFGRLADQVAAVESAGADRLQIDIMDGHFVPNLSMGPMFVAGLRTLTRLPLEAHLMVERPENWVQPVVEAGADIIIAHAEATPHLDRVIEQIAAAGRQPAVALNPATPWELIELLLPSLRMVLLMTVNPGFGGQRFIPYMTDKIAALRARLHQLNLPLDIEVDGGIDADTLPAVAAAGANVFVAGTAVFGHPQGPAVGLRRLQAAWPPA